MNDEQPKETKLDQIRKEMQENDKTTPAKNDRIVHKLAEGISRRVSEPTETPADLIMEQAQKSKLLVGKGPQQVVAAKPEPKKGDLELPRLNDLPPIEINGHQFKRTNVPHLDAITIIMYIVAEILSDDPRVDSILRQVQFMFPDASGNQIYPKIRNRKVKKAKKRNVRPTK